MKTVDYNGLSQELAALMSRLESGDLGVDEAVTAYERGLAIVKQLETHLKKAENRVAELKDELDAQSDEEE